MPFTFSHPAVVVPLAKKRFNLSALVIGSMMPDFDNLLPKLPFIFESHSLHGLFTFCVPVGFIIWIILQKVVKKPVVSFFPTGHQLRLANLLGDIKVTSLGDLFWVLFSIWFGSLTHVVLDSFTHNYGIFVHIIPFLRMELFTVGTRTVRMYYIFQYGLAALGIFLLVFWYWRWYKRTPKLELVPHPYMTGPFRWLILAVIFIITVAGGLVVAIHETHFPFSLNFIYLFLRSFFVGSMGFLLVQIVLFCIVWWGWQKTNQL